MDISQHNMKLDKFLHRGQNVIVFKICQEIKDGRIRPDYHTYAYLLQACELSQLGLEARAVFEDMINTGLQPRLSEFNALLTVRRPPLT